MKTMMEVSNAIFEKVQVGKSFNFDGRVGRVVEKHAEGAGKSSTGWNSCMPMISVEWRK